MKQSKFDEIVSETLNQASNVLLVKAKEYVRNNNPMHNFDEGARKKGIIREKVIDGFALKHEISIDDIVNDIESDKLPSYDMVNEKFGDAINYLILKKASILDRLDNKKLPF